MKDSFSHVDDICIGSSFAIVNFASKGGFSCVVKYAVVAGRFTEEVRAVDYQEARQVALAKILMPQLLVLLLFF